MTWTERVLEVWRRETSDLEEEKIIRELLNWTSKDLISSIMRLIIDYDTFNIQRACYGFLCCNDLVSASLKRR